MRTAIAIETGFTRGVGHTRDFVSFDYACLPKVFMELLTWPCIPGRAGREWAVAGELVNTLDSLWAFPLKRRPEARLPKQYVAPIISLNVAKNKAKIIRVDPTRNRTHLQVTEYFPWDDFRQLIGSDYTETIENMGGVVDFEILPPS